MSAAVALALLATTACENIYDSELDCSTKIKLVFNKHRQALQSTNGQAANAFASTVGSMHIYIYDEQSGKLVFETFETTDNLKTEAELNIGSGSERCYLPVALESGRYRIVAWCGFDENDQNNAFFLHGQGTRAEYDECSVKVSAATGNPINEAKYESVYHGTANKVTVIPDGKTVIPVELTKNNNDIAVWVQHASANISPEEYEVVYTDANGSVKFEDNSLTRNDVLEYRPHTTSVLTTSTEYNGEQVEAGALIAHISTSRLMAAHKNDARLEVRGKDGYVHFSIPFIKYLLEMQTFTSDGQFYLDCEDTFNCSFYLSGETGVWTPARIIINNWVKVPDQTGSI